MRDLDDSVWGGLIGTPFSWRGRGPASFDCYGLVREMLRRTGVDTPALESPVSIDGVPTAVALEFALGRWVACPKQPGAMVVFNMPVMLDGRRRLAVAHCGFVLNETDFIHSWEQTGGVTVERLHDWDRRIAGFYKFTDKKNDE